ncbi:GtrA family protein [Candidatus Saccharibacteria bacterium]|nr:GtrA family protein [Candidatus Saccharibacteria bacterium]
MSLTKYTEARTVKSQLVRFLTTGVFITLLDFVAYAIFLQLSFSPTVANYCSTSIALITSFFVNKNFTFRAKDSNQVRRFTLFVVVTLIGIWAIQPVIIIMLLPLTSSIFDSLFLAPIAAKVVATIFSTAWNYILYKTIVFKETSS